MNSLSIKFYNQSPDKFVRGLFFGLFFLVVSIIFINFALVKLKEKDMELTRLKKLCYNAAIVKEFAESNEKALKIQFIKECFLKNLKKMDVSESGVYSLNMEKRYIKIGFNEKLPLVSLNYNPMDEKQNSLCNITAFCYDKEKNSMMLDLAIDNLSMAEIHDIFIHLTIMFNI